MIPIYEADRLEDLPLFDRGPQAEADVGAAVDAVLETVRTRGDEALREYTRRFDGADLTSFEVTEGEMEAAWDSVDEDFRETLRQAAANIRRFHEAQVHRDFCLTDRPGVVLGQRYTPIEKVGVCVPGSPVAFPSTILMNVIPAKIAGVREIVVVTPPDENGAISGPRPWRRRRSPGRTGCSSWAAPRRWRPWPTARRRFPGWTRSWAPAASSWPPPSGRYSARWPST